MSLRTILNADEDKLRLLLTALEQKAKQHDKHAKNTLNAGYGSGRTQAKAEEHERLAAACRELESELAAQWD